MKPVILGVSGPKLTADERTLLIKGRPRGVILFTRNIIDQAQLAELTGSLRDVLPAGAVLMVDQEGGRVARLRPPHWAELPAAAALTTEEAAYAHGLALGAMARAAGFDVVAAPVLDLGFAGTSSVIGDRALSRDPEVVGRLGARIAAGLIDAGVVPVMKHIPGHGRALVDSHLVLPVVDAPDLVEDFAPFAANNDLPWAMTAHIVYPAYDPIHPATLSATVIRRVIRGMIGFKGILVSDDLAMNALSGTPTARVQAALRAGCDIALYCTGDLAANAAILDALADG